MRIKINDIVNIDSETAELFLSNSVFHSSCMLLDSIGEFEASEVIGIVKNLCKTIDAQANELMKLRSYVPPEVFLKENEIL